MQTYPVKYVLTGGPCTGKTTTINYLKKLGYQTIPEAATLLQEHNIANNETPFDLNSRLFHEKLISKQLELESKVDKSKTTFIDRGIIDTISYYNFFGLNSSKKISIKVKNHKYTKIFILDFLNVYATNKMRKESAETAKKIQQQIHKTYNDFGYKPIVIPFMPVEKRVEFILNNIGYKNYEISNSYKKTK